MPSTSATAVSQPLYSSSVALPGYRLDEDIKVSQPGRPYTMLNPASGTLDDFPPPPPRMPTRPISDLSDLTQTDMASVTTRQSVNEILSMADIPVNSDTESMNIDSFSMDCLYTGGDQLHNDIKPILPEYGSSTAWKPDSSSSTLPGRGNGSNLSQWKDTSLGNLGHWKDNIGSTTSIDTVKQILSPDSTMNVDGESLANSQNIDIDQIYDDVISCVYDDVDSKYDDMSLAGIEPPAPPIRRRGTIDEGSMGIDKPLPTTPKNPSLITLLSEKKNELLKEKEEKRKQSEDLKK